MISKELKETPKSKRMTIKIFDGNASIAVQKWCGRQNEMALYDTLNKEFPDKDFDFMHEEFRRVSIELYPKTVKPYPNCKEVLISLKKKLIVPRQIIIFGKKIIN